MNYEDRLAGEYHADVSSLMEEIKTLKARIKELESEVEDLGYEALERSERFQD